MSEGMEKNAFSIAMKDIFITFDRHCLIYFFLSGYAFGLFNPAGPWGAACGMWVLGGFIWYTGKAILITGNTVATMRKNGEPLFKAGGLRV